MSSRSSRRPPWGFTLVELLVVIAIIGVLVALLLPAVQAARESARRMTCQSQLKQMTLGFHSTHDTLRQFPAWNGTGYNSWLVPVLPHMEQQAVAEMYGAALTGGDVRSRPAAGRGAVTALSISKVLRCPSDVGALQDGGVYQRFGPGEGGWASGFYTGVTSYGANAGTSTSATNGIVYQSSVVRIADITDGTSNTLLLGERRTSDPNWTGLMNLLNPGTIEGRDLRLYGGWWASSGGIYRRAVVQINYTIPSNFTASTGLVNRINAYGSLHPRGCNISYCDGSVKYFKDTLSLITLQALSSRDGNEVVTDE